MQFSRIIFGPVTVSFHEIVSVILVKLGYLYFCRKTLAVALLGMLFLED